MARTVVNPAVVGQDEGLVTDGYRRSDIPNLVGRFISIVAGAVLTVIGLIALAQLDWSASGFDAPAVSVAGMTFRPWIAIATTLLGLLALAAGASRDRESKLFVGGLLVAVGIALLVANPTLEGVVITDRMGWIAIIVGGVLAVTGLVTGRAWVGRRAV
jgi:hypothetical protein